MDSAAFMFFFFLLFYVQSIEWFTEDQAFLRLYTDKKDNQIFLIYKEILSGAVAKSYMRKGFLIYEAIKKISPYMRRCMIRLLIHGYTLSSHQVVSWQVH
jgi:hypothetical protein